MLPLPGNQLRLRLRRLLLGLVLFGWGIAAMVVADLGLGPWEVLHQGISFRTGIPIGTVGILTGFVVLFGWIPLRERIGLGTVLNVILIGIVIDLTLWGLPDRLDGLALRWGVMVTGVVMIGIGSGYYIGAGMGPGPRDGLMTGLAKRGLHIGWVRTGIEVTVLCLGWLLGGTVGAGTLAFAFGIGPLIAYVLPRLTVREGTRSG
jgi:uncharacterized membrane protein YczE